MLEHVIERLERNRVDLLDLYQQLKSLYPEEARFLERGCFQITIAQCYLKERSLAKRIPFKEPIMSGPSVGHVAVAYPTYEQGADAVLHLGKTALGQETLGHNELEAQAWIALGAGLGQLMPLDGPMKAGEMPAEFKAVFAEQVRMHADGAGKIDWKSLLKTLLPLILSLLGCLVLAFSFVATASAAEQAVRPPQATLAVHMPHASECACQPGELCQCGSSCLCHVVQAREMRDYATMHARSLREGKPLVVWVGTVARTEGLEDFLHCAVQDLEGIEGEGVMVAVPEQGRLLRIADLPATAQAAFIRDCIRRRRARVTYQPTFTQPLSFSGFSGGACRS